MTYPPLALPSSGGVIFLQSLLCDGLYDLAPDTGVPLVVPSLVRTIHAKLLDRNVSISTLESALFAIAKGALTNRSSFVQGDELQRCITTMEAIFSLPIHNRSVVHAAAASKCYCVLSNDRSSRQTVLNTLAHLLLKLISPPHASLAEIKKLLRDSVGVMPTDAQLNSIIMGSRVIGTFLKDPRFLGLIQDKMDPFTASKLLLCPVTPSWADQRKLAPEQNDASTSSQVSSE